MTPGATIAHRVLRHSEDRPDAPAHLVREASGWKAHSWADYGRDVRRAARALIALGVEPGDSVCILGDGTPQWAIFDVAAMAIGAVPAGIYATSSASEVQYIVHHCRAKVVLVDSPKQWQKLREHRASLPELRAVAAMGEGDGAEGERSSPHSWSGSVLSWSELLDLGEGVAAEAVVDRMEALDPQAPATLIYTSGTTGPPKAVMLSHHNLSWTADTLAHIAGLDASGRGLSYLPLAHIAEQMISIHGPATTGSAVYFARSLETVSDDLREVQPTIMFGVPRIWEKYHAGVSARLDAATGVRKALIRWVQSVCKRSSVAYLDGSDPGWAVRVQLQLARRLVLDKLKPALGLGSATLCVSGAAPVAVEILEFFASLDIPILEIYGQSEDCGPTSFNLPGAAKFGTVGRPIPGVEVRIAADGEILVRGPNVFLGYLHDPEATAEALEDGWLHTGDLGELDADGFLSVTGRKKDIIITAGGKNIAPSNIELALKNTPLINEAVIVGDRRKYLTALVTLDVEALAAAGKSPVSESTRAAVQAAIDDINRDLARVETIKKFTILPRNLTVEAGELTPTLKVRRSVVAQHFAAEIDAMYAEPVSAP